MKSHENAAEVREDRLKKAYQPPKLERFGNMAQITLGEGGTGVDSKAMRDKKLS